MTNDYTHLPYRPCVGAMVLNTHNDVFVGSRIDKTSDAWQMPQGGVDEGEDIKDAMFRELGEEIGTSNVEIIAMSQDWYYYDVPTELVPKLWSGKYRGQKQRWFLLRLQGDESQINIRTKHPEFDAWKWVSPQELPSIIVPFKRKLYEDVLGEFLPLIKEDR